MRTFLFKTFIIMGLSLVLLASEAKAGERVALVIGNSAYQNADPLKNPKHDAEDIAATLRRLGFKVILATDLTKAGMDETIKSFAQALAKASAGVFFYAGHGLQVNGSNYLVPVDAKLTSPVGMEFETIRLDLIQRTMEQSTTTNILIIDACRNNPLSRNLSRGMGTRSLQIGQGLAPIESGVGTLVAYSTQPDSVALDGAGRNSPFAEAMLKYIDRKGDDISSIIINVRNEMRRKTQDKQVPWEHSALVERFYFAAPDGAPNAPASYATAAIPAPATDAAPGGLELEFWNNVKDSPDPAMLKAYVDRFPKGAFAPLANLKIAALEKRLAPVETYKPHAELSPDFILRFHKELKRVGCYGGEPKTSWGEDSQLALIKFAAARNLTDVGFEPAQPLLDSILAAKSRVCPLECNPGEKQSRGGCAAAKAEEKTTAEPKPRREKYKQRHASRRYRERRARYNPYRQHRDRYERYREHRYGYEGRRHFRLCLGGSCGSGGGVVFRIR